MRSENAKLTHEIKGRWSDLGYKMSDSINMIVSDDTIRPDLRAAYVIYMHKALSSMEGLERRMVSIIDRIQSTK